MLAGSVSVGKLQDWSPEPGSLISWQVTPKSREKAGAAPVSDVPPSYQQARHLRQFSEQAKEGIEYSRLLIGSCDVPGRCDLRAMTYTFNAHVRRHDTYRSWFDYIDADHIVRHTIADPNDIEVRATRHGEVNAEEMREHILETPSPLQWDCFRFGIIQREEHFTLYMSIDHLLMDAQFTAVILLEWQAMYNAITAGGQPIALPTGGDYDAYCRRQRAYAGELTADSPEIKAWVEFAEGNDNTIMPTFPLPLGDRSGPHAGSTLSLTLLDEDETHRFEAACVASGARFIGGLLACLAMTERELTGADHYSGVSPIDTRQPDEMVTMGWYTGVVPVAIPVGASTFAEVAGAAQASFDAGIALSRVPFDRVIELAPHISRPGPNWPLVNFLDGGVPPVSAMLAALEGRNAGLFSDGRASYQLSIFIYRFTETVLTIVHPDNPVALESLIRYTDTLKSMCAAVAAGREPALGQSRQ